jgi:regulator of protease activity HflC (stomatin/prohibitin superfamily)
MKTFLKLVFMVFVLIVAVGILKGITTDPPTEAEKAATAARQQATQAQEDAQRKVEQKADAEKARRERNFQFTVLLAKSIKEAARDPESLVWESILANDDTSLVCFRFRAKNGFGGFNREVATYANGKLSQSAGIWNKNCANRELNDMIAVKHAL